MVFCLDFILNSRALNMFYISFKHRKMKGNKSKITNHMNHKGQYSDL